MTRAHAIILPARRWPRLEAVAILVLLGSSVSADAAVTRYEIDPVRSTVEFKVRHLAATMTGSFAKFGGTIAFDSTDLARCQVEATIEVDSLVTDDARRSRRLARDDFFATEKFPTMKFHGNIWRRTGEGIYEIDGRIEIKGATRPITIEVREEPGPTGTARRRWNATATLNRTDFGVSGGPPGLIGDNVRIAMNIEAIAGQEAAGSAGRATMIAPNERGERLHLHGTVFDADGRTPVPNAILRIFHTDVDGLYARDTDNSDGERNPRLQIVMRTDDQGRYEVHTILPGRYPGGRTPAHVHMTASAEGYRERTATFSFAGDPALTPEDYERHGRDGTFSAVRPLEPVEQGVWRCRRDIRLAR